MLKQKPSFYMLFLLSALLYLAMGYGIDRYQTAPLFASYFSLFALFLLIVRKHLRIEKQQLRLWIAAALFFRALLLFSVPALSDDFYRFIWDGRLLASGFHPFAQVPSAYMTGSVSVPGIDAELFSRLNSRETFTNYPPLSQFIFWLSVKLSDGSVYGSMVSMKTIILIFEVLTLWVIARVLEDFKVHPSTILLYALNPLVILELSGNLHFEGVMVFFLFLAIFLLTRGKIMLSSAAYALSVCTKLVPLLFLPLLVRHLGWKKSVTYWAWTAVMTALLFVPLFSPQIISGLSTSLGYYFQRFEFNASVYYLIREAGYGIFGFNIIQLAGPLLALAAMVIILIIAFRRMPRTVSGHIHRNLFTTMVWCMFVYLMSATILHPWYIITLLALSLLTPYRFPTAWTCAIFFTYAGYTRTGFQENLFLVALEYAAVITYLLYETYGPGQKRAAEYFLSES